jgi:hypothetical protein
MHAAAESRSSPNVDGWIPTVPPLEDLPEAAELLVARHAT